MNSKYNKPDTDAIGRPICEVCNKAFDLLGNHVKQKHGIEAQDYKAEYGYNPNKGLTSTSYKENMKDFYANNKESIDKNLSKCEPHQFKKKE